ncbi:phosphoribosylanthranilate isomerase [Lewinella marina]|uniref:N-(5'-phosphoribosyl)anthranilate isomerase n=1 Tax=Neolewinella marina TaxID=438751 RepID=A0A2G0CF09_9BACT|nr:phosphoribosylanthranilate isomerase [Neolewinella marina]NJB85768.1 phosphoribosylanthranilate isomerase [Neolewinella marina]PHK98559.1 phosphoribosylanthranilate isomerase [Neolewinella marina]
MKIKVCGLRDPENIAAVSGLDVDYLGLIFHPDSPRFAGQPSLSEWLTDNVALLNGHERVGVFVNGEIDYLLNTVHDYHLDWVQLHGSESPGYCQELKLLWSVNTLRRASICKAFSITDDFDFRRTNDYVNSCSLFVFDTGGQAQAGGTGKKWDWSKLEEYQGPVPFLLSGGIGPEDAAAINQVRHPQFKGVDLNSQFELEPGRKDVERLRQFIRELN